VTPVLRYSEEPGLRAISPGSSEYLRTGVIRTFEVMKPLFIKMNPEQFHSDPDPADALSRVTDEQSTHHEARRWAETQLVEGRSPEELVEQLVVDDWEISEAEHLVEVARKETRAERGVITRDDVVRELNVDYRRATGGLSVAFRSGLFGIYGFLTGFMAAMRSARKLKAMKQSKK
jgi:hypothetical protein